MKTKSNTFFKTIGAIALFFALTFSANVNAFGGGDNHRSNNNRNGNKHHTQNNRNGDKHDGDKKHGDKSDSIPLGGLGILVLGAAAFGVKKLRDNKNDKI